MSHSDPIADMLTRIRNAGRVNKREVRVRASNLCEGIAKVLQQEGYITGYDRIDDNKQGFLRIALKYDRGGRHAISDIQRFSRPGCRVYRPVDDLPDVLNGLGISIVSTSQGVISDRKCRESNIGGEILCTVS